MTDLPSTTGKEVISALKKLGFEVVKVKGSHHKMKKDGANPVTVPVHAGKDIKKPLLKRILNAAGVSEEEFRDKI